MTLLPGLGSIGSQLYLYYVVLVVLVLVLAAASTLRRSAVGRVIIATRDNERAIASFGVKPSVVKLRVLALSGFVAATAGVFFAADWQSVTPTYFTADVSIAILAIPVIGGLGSLGGAVAAAVMLYMATFFVGPHVEGLLGSVGQNAGFSALRRWCRRRRHHDVYAEWPRWQSARLVAGLPQQEGGTTVLLEARAQHRCPERRLVPSDETAASVAVADAERAAAGMSFATRGRREQDARGASDASTRPSCRRSASGGRRRGHPFRRHCRPQGRDNEG